MADASMSVTGDRSMMMNFIGVQLASALTCAAAKYLSRWDSIGCSQQRMFPVTQGSAVAATTARLSSHTESMCNCCRGSLLLCTFRFAKYRGASKRTIKIPFSWRVSGYCLMFLLHEVGVNC